MPLDDITLRAMAFTRDSITDAVRTIREVQTLQDANDLTKQIRNSEMDEAQKRNALEQLSQQAVFQLAQVGTTPQSIQQVAEAIAPPIRQPQTIQEALVSPDATTRQRGERASALQLQGQLAKAAAGQKDFTDFKTRSQFLKDFENQKDVKDTISAINSVEDSMAELSVGTPQSLNLSVKALVSAREGGRITDKDFELALPGQSLPRRFSRAAYTNLLNRATGGDISEMQNLLNKIKENATGRIRQRLRGRARSLAPTLGVTAEQAENVLLTDLGLTAAQPSTREFVAQRDGNGYNKGDRVRITLDQNGRPVKLENLSGR